MSDTIGYRYSNRVFYGYRYTKGRVDAVAFKYEQVGQQLAQDIARGDIQPGHRLPSLRRLAKRYGISVNTATRIYEQLESGGLIVSEPKRGFFVRALDSQSMAPVQQRKAVLVSRDRTDVLMTIQRNALRKDVINLGSGVIAEDFMPVTELGRSVRRASRRHGEALSVYGDPAGEPTLRQAVADVMQRRTDFLPSAEQILITNGCMEAVGLCVQTLTRPDDVVAIFSPCYNGLLMMLQKMERRVLEIPCDSSGPDLDYLESLLQQRAFRCLVFSAIAFNPLGFSMSSTDKRRMAQLAAEYDIPFVEDDTFGELAYTGIETTPVYSFDTVNRIFYCSSFSKSLCPGFRLGWISTRGMLDGFIRQKMALNLSCNSVTQYALADYLFSGGYPAHLQRLRWRLQRETTLMRDAIAAHLPEGTAVSHPTGGFFLWVQLPSGVAAMDVYRKAAELKVLLAPGDIFSLAALHDDKIRISCGQAWSSECERAVEFIGGIVTELGS